MNAGQSKLFRPNPNSKLGRRLLRAQLGFALAYSPVLLKEIGRLTKKSVKMSRRGHALREMARLARETGNSPRFAWLSLCEKLVYYRGDRSLGRAKKLHARHQRLYEKSKALYELLGYKKQ